MNEPRVDLRDRWLAGLLAFLIPGAGHAYQRRFLKAGIYSVCILGLFLYGMKLSYGKIVQCPPPGVPKTRMFSYAAQAGVGLPALYAVYQSHRFHKPENREVTVLEEPLTARFAGEARIRGGSAPYEGPVTGDVSLETTQGRFHEQVIVGKFQGEGPDGRLIEFSLGEGVELAKLVQADPRRQLVAHIVESDGENTRVIGELEGSIPRRFADWFEAPMDAREEQQLHGELGKVHELALVFTWIAGLLNILAIWDAFDGPAYGYGDEPPVDDEADDTARARSRAAAAVDKPPAETPARARSSR